MRLREIKVGMRVRVKDNAKATNTRGPGNPGWNSNGKMDWTIGQEGEVTEVGAYYVRVKLKKSPGHLTESWSYMPASLEPARMKGEGEAKSEVFLPVLGHDYYRPGMIFKRKNTNDLGMLTTVEGKIYLIHLESSNWWFRSSLPSSVLGHHITKDDMDKICEGKFDNFELKYLTFKDMVEGKQFKLERRVRYVERTPSESVSDGFYASKEDFEKRFPNLKFVAFAD